MVGEKESWNRKTDLPIIVEGAEKIAKTVDVKMLESLGLAEELLVISEKKVRAGVGKMRAEGTSQRRVHRLLSARIAHC